ncbi:MAG: hypothetical protein U0K81_04690 [Paludibacteraceae bacterium]|nr:hypothetical protein [Paludibacteraceae bacterium]
MKKIFTFFALSIMAMSVMAAETVLWEGSWYVSWDEPEGSEHREWKHLGQADFAAYEVGTTVCFYMEQAEGATYAKYQIDKWDWTSLPGQTPTDFSGNTVAKLPITQEVKDAIAAGGFAIHGHGFNMVKVTLTDEATEDPEPQGDVLWEGDHFVSWHHADGNPNKEWKFLSQATFAGLAEGSTLYFLLHANPMIVDPTNTDDQMYSAYKFDDGWWGTLPGYGQVDFVNDTVATLVVTAEIKGIVAERGFAIHGHGFNVQKVSLSPIEIPTSVENVAIKNDGIRYNLMGQIVDENYKGIIIINGRKMIVR